MKYILLIKTEIIIALKLIKPLYQIPKLQNEYKWLNGSKFTSPVRKIVEKRSLTLSGVYPFFWQRNMIDQLKKSVDMLLQIKIYCNIGLPRKIGSCLQITTGLY